jgi:hypothetical protein
LPLSLLPNPLLLLKRELPPRRLFIYYKKLSCSELPPKELSPIELFIYYYYGPGLYAKKTSSINTRRNK